MSYQVVLFDPLPADDFPVSSLAAKIPGGISTVSGEKVPASFPARVCLTSTPYRTLGQALEHLEFEVGRSQPGWCVGIKVVDDSKGFSVIGVGGNLEPSVVLEEVSGF